MAGAAAPRPAPITLRMSEKDAAKAAFSSDNGKVWIVLRPAGGRRADHAGHRHARDGSLRHQARGGGEVDRRPTDERADQGLVALDDGVDERRRPGGPAEQQRRPDRRCRRRPRGELDDPAGGPDGPARRRLRRLLRPGALPDRRRREAAARSARRRALRPVRRTASCGASSRSGADDIIILPESARATSPFAFEKAVARKQGTASGDGRRARADDLRPRPEGRHRQDAHGVQPRRRARGRRAHRVAIVDLDLQFGDVGLSLGLAPEKTIYDLATSGGSLDAEKLDGYLADAPVGRARAVAPTRPDQAGAITTEFLRDVYAVLRVDARLRDRRHAARLHARGDRVDRQLLAHLHGGDARLALAQEHEARPRDARADGLRPGAHRARPQPRRQPCRASPRGRRRDRRAGARTCSSRATATSRARSTRACRSSSPSRRSEAAKAFRQLAVPVPRRRDATPAKRRLGAAGRRRASDGAPRAPRHDAAGCPGERGATRSRRSRTASTSR